MRGLVVTVALALSAGCGSCSEEDAAEPGESAAEDTVTEATEQPDAAPIELPVAATATEPPDPSPALGVHTNAVTLDGDMFRTPLEGGRIPGDVVEDGHIAPLQVILANLRFSAGGAPGQFRSSLSLRADRRARWDTVRTVTATAASEGFVNMKVLARAGDDVRWFRVRAERDDTEPHLRAHLDGTGVSIRAPGLAAALEQACGGTAPDGPLRVDDVGTDWTWESLDPCQRTVLAEITAETPAAGVTAEDDVAWERAVHLLDRLRSLRDDPNRLALLLE